jgi:acyl-homoserine-lactone acylase
VRATRVRNRRWPAPTVAGIAVLAVAAASCSPGEGPESIPLPTSPTTSTTTTTTTTTTTLVAPRYEAEIRRTSGGVPHISGTTADDVAYGQGWASAEDDGCTLPERVLEVLGRRAAALGPGDGREHVERDFAWRAIGIAGIAAVDFDAASDAVRDQYEAFTEGWNDHLAEVGAAGTTGWCAGADWLGPLEPVQVYTVARADALVMSSEAMLPYLAAAAPPPAERSGRRQSPVSPTAEEQFAFAAAVSALDLTGGGHGIGWAIGRERIEGGSGGLLLANPHRPWHGPQRLSEVHLTVPGRSDVYGATPVGRPGVTIGFTDGVAWTTTRSPGARMTAYTLALDPAAPTTYLLDGAPVEMESALVTVEIRRADGSFDTETRRMWRSEYGPIIDVPGVGWTGRTALTFRDANLDNDEFVEHSVRLAEVAGLEQLVELHRTYQGEPVSETVAVGADGTVWYADLAATPDLTAEAQLLHAAAAIDDPLTRIAAQHGLVLLDGSDSRFHWADDPAARDPGLVPFDRAPQVTRSDVVIGSGDGYWAPSPDATYSGDVSTMYGPRATARSMIGRRSAAVLGPANRTGLAGSDGAFSAEELRIAAFDNTAHTAVLLRSAAVEACRATPLVAVDASVTLDGTVILPAATVDVGPACAVLAAWDGVHDLDRAGPIVWREMMLRFGDADFRGPGPLFADRVDPTDPTGTPAIPAADAGPLLRAMARAVQTLGVAGFDVDTTLGAAQFAWGATEPVPVHGGTAAEGVTNVVTWADEAAPRGTQPPGAVVMPGGSLRAEGYPVNTGTSSVLVVDYSGDTPAAWTVLAHGQAATASVFDEGTRQFAEKSWRRVAFTDAEIRSDSQLVATTVVAR